jgi:hypothetical protein
VRLTLVPSGTSSGRRDACRRRAVLDPLGHLLPVCRLGCACLAPSYGEFGYYASGSATTLRSESSSSRPEISSSRPEKLAYIYRSRTACEQHRVGAYISGAGGCYGRQIIHWYVYHGYRRAKEGAVRPSSSVCRLPRSLSVPGGEPGECAGRVVTPTL